MSVPKRTQNLEVVNAEAERDLIGSVLLSPGELLSMDLPAEAFSSQMWRTVWEVLQVSVREDGAAFDVLTVAQRLARVAHGDVDWLSALAYAQRDAISGAAAQRRAEQVRVAYVERQAKTIAYQLGKDIDRDGLSAVDVAVQALMELSRPASRYEYGIRESLRIALDDIERSAEGGEIPGVPSGIERLDEVLGGFQGGDLIVVGARPSVGKTAFLINLALAANCSAGIITAEQPHVQMTKRMISVRGHINGTRLRNASKLEEHDWPRLTSATQWLMDQQIRLNDQPSIHVDEVLRQARAWVQAYGIKILYVDYLQRLKGGDERSQKHERVAYSAEMLKFIARDLDIPVVALAQVKREVEQRPNKRPRMGDLSDSSAIEKEADVIMTLYRDEVYNEDSGDKGLAEIIVDKNRHGPTGMVRTVWIAESMRFENLLASEKFAKVVHDET